MSQKTRTKDFVKEIVSIFTPYTDGILLEGSGAWGEVEVARDIDLEFITPNFDFFRLLSLRAVLVGELPKVIENFTSKILHRVLTLNLEMFDLKIFPHGQEISLRFTRSALFNRICRLSFIKIKKTESILQYRLCPTKPLNVQRNFSGGKIKYRRWHFFSGEQQLIETPIVIVDSRGRFYPGEIIDRCLAFPKILYEKNVSCQQSLRKLKIGVMKRLILEEEQGLHRIKPALSLCLSRRERISEKLLKQLDKEESKIRLQISNE